MFLNTEISQGTIKLESPLHHGSSEQYGTSKLLLTLPTIVINDNDEFEIINIPAVHGNSIRGYLRRLIMQDLLDEIDYELNSKKLYHFLFTGGMLEAVASKDSGFINIPLKTRIRETLPPISLLGSALGNQMFDGKLKCMIANLICKENAETYGLNKNNYHSCYELQYTDFGTRLDDLKTKTEDENAQQMKYDFETVVKGSTFHHEFILEDTNPVEYSCFQRMLKLWEERPFLGGKSNTGYGKISFQYTTMINTSDKLYLNFLKDNAENIKSLLEELSSIWK